jgi:hypothetical protein
MTPSENSIAVNNNNNDKNVSHYKSVLSFIYVTTPPAV